jgi:hypothetical protein
MLIRTLKYVWKIEGFPEKATTWHGAILALWAETIHILLRFPLMVGSILLFFLILSLPYIILVGLLQIFF